LAQVLTKEPDLSKVPARVRRLLGRCLEKDPKERLRDIGEVRYLLEEPAAERHSGPSRSRLAWSAAAALAIVAAGLGWVAWRATRPVERPLARLDVDLGQDISLAGGGNNGSTVAISPDGTRLAYMASLSGGPTRLFTRRLDQAQTTELRGTEGATGVFFSPDGQWLGFFASGRLNKISVEGGAVVPLAVMDTMIGASWGANGDIVVGHRYGPLHRVPSIGGTLAQVTELAKDEVTHMAPSVLPGGKGVVFVTGGVTNQVVSFSNHRRKILAQRGFSPRYLATSENAGHLIYVDQGTLFAVPFDPNSLEALGAPVPIFNEVAQANGSGFAQFDVSNEGTLVYRRSNNVRPLRTIQWVDSSGKTESLISTPGLYSFPRLSPEGERLALTVEDSHQTIGDIWVDDLKRGIMTKLTSGGNSWEPVWSPDGHHLVFGSNAPTPGLFWIRDDGAGQPQPLGSGEVREPSSFDPQGKRLAFSQPSGGPDHMVWVLPVSLDNDQLRAAGMPEPVPHTATRGNPVPMFSPDGRWLAYSADGSGRAEVYVQPASGQGQRIQISNDGGRFPVWSRASREILYRSRDQILVVSYSVTGDTFHPEKPRPWGKVDQMVKDATPAFDLTRDGKRLVVLAAATTSDPDKPEHEVVLLMHFFDHLRQRVPLPR
jgi:serine/threonine-protein kinase